MIEFVRIVIVPILVLAVVLSTIPIYIWMERRVCAKIQQRLGPNRVGPAGLLQPMADVVKLLFKEDITPLHADRLVYLLAPVVTVMSAIAALAVVPIGADLHVRQYLLFGPVLEQTVPLQVADVNIGVLWVMALSSLAVYGVVLAGWASNSKWSLMGGVRAAAQMVSYELGMGLAIVAVVLSNNAYALEHNLAESGSLLYHSLSLRTAVLSQEGMSIFGWNALWQFPAFAIFCVCAVAETNRAPFDLPEAEQELVAGFHTEYSSFRFAMFMMGEYIHMITLSAVGTCLFLGGWLSPFGGIPWIERLTVANIPVLGAVMPVVWFLLKVSVCMFLFVWLRWTMPRMRWDQLMRLGWMVLLPGALAWVMVVAVLQGVANLLAGPNGLIEQLSPLDAYRIFVALTTVATGLIIALRRAADSVGHTSDAGAA